MAEKVHDFDFGVESREPTSCSGQEILPAFRGNLHERKMQMTTSFHTQPAITAPSRTLVREFYGKSVRSFLGRILVPMSEALPGDLVALRATGLAVEHVPFINSRQFVKRTRTGFIERRLDFLRPQCAQAVGRISDDHELHGDIADV